MSRIGLSQPPQINFGITARTLAGLETPVIEDLVRGQLPASSLAAATLSATLRHTGASYEGPADLKTLLHGIDAEKFRTNPFVIPQPHLVSIADLIPDWQGMQGALTTFAQENSASGLMQISTMLTNVSDMDQVLLSRASSGGW